MQVDEAIRSRKSVRSFLPTPVPQSVVRHILELAARAPSGNNVQAWRVHVVTGNALRVLGEAMRAEARDNTQSCIPEYSYYPDQWVEPYLSRRRQCGYSLYEVLGIDRQDMAGRQRQMLRNFTFFDAPVGIMVTTDRRLNTGSFMDLGMFLQNIMLAARGQGLHTCPQAAFADLHHIVRQHLELGDEEILACGVSLGFEDEGARENALQMPREPVDAFARFYS